VTLVLLLDASHHGGTLTHGQGFLTQNAPGPIRALIQRLETSTPRPTARAGLRTDEIRSAAHRVFESKCHSCHGPQKQKGKYRMDQRDSLIRGGSSGEAAVVPGDPGRSRLFRQIVLPKEHDDVMPPSGKEPLDDTEVLAVLRWIQAGAP
jgi:mono/diheme cytochrome c family protein